MPPAAPDPLTPSALRTDLYQLTMAAAYFRAGLAEREAVFHLSFREHPFGGAFAVACGLAQVVETLEALRFAEEELDYLRDLRGANGGRLFDAAFLDSLRALELRCDLDAIPEGRVVFAHEPLLRVRGPLAQCQLLETPLLNLCNVSTLIATKAARIVRAARGKPVLEFGLRRAHGPAGGLLVSRAAFVGGCAGTSNLEAGRAFGIPVRGTHAHSFVMSFADELPAFRAYADAFPDDTILLVDTYDSERGIRDAVELGGELRARGHELAGIRLDSGDLGALSLKARRMLDEAGFPEARIVASGDLDEWQIERLEDDGAPIDVYGVGTRLATAYDEPALGGVYKLAAIRSAGGALEPRLKLSDDPGKGSLPGCLGVRRHWRKGRIAADVIYDVELGCDEGSLSHPTDPERSLTLPPGTTREELLVPVLRRGGRVGELPGAARARARSLEELDRLAPATLRLRDPEPVPVGVEPRLQQLRERLGARLR